jgi:hypothetical protein
LHDCCSDPKFMEEIKHLKIETATHIFLKFMRMQGDVFDSCMHSFFVRTDVGAGSATDSLVQSVCWIEPGCRDDRPRLPLTIRSPGLPLYLPYIYIYIGNGSPGLSLLMEAPARTRSTQHPRVCVSHAVDSQESRTISIRQYTNAYIYI